MAPVRTDSSATPKPPVTPKRGGEKARVPSGKERAPAPQVHAADHVYTPPEGPILTGGDGYDAGSVKKAKNFSQMVKSVATETLAHGGAKGLVTFKPLLALMGLAKLSFIQDAFQEVGPNESLGFTKTFGRMVLGAVYGGMTMFIAGGVPLGIIGAITSAAGPAAFVLLGLIAAVTLWGAAAGAYQGYKSSLPPRHAGTKVKGERQEGQSTTVTLESANAGPEITLESTQARPARGKLLAPPTLDASVTLTREGSGDSSGLVGVSKTTDAAAAVINAATKEESEEGKTKQAVADAAGKQASRTAEGRRTK